MFGHAGKILRVNLGTGKVSELATRNYEHWVGGHGMGSAIFWDLCKDKTIGPFDEGNVITIMTSPLTGTLAPGGASRTEMQGIGAQSSPIGWFTRSNLGGRFGAMLKYAGWDGIVIEGKASVPVWLDIRNDDVKIQEAGRLWGLDTWETQQQIWKQVTAGAGWVEVESKKVRGRTTQKPAVLAIGPAGENICRIAAIIHDAGNAAGQGGFGAVWGSKNLKAISVIGTQSVSIADPKALLEARTWAMKNFTLNVDDPAVMTNASSVAKNFQIRSLSSFGSLPMPVTFWSRSMPHRPQACVGCPAGCRTRTASGLGNESSCAETAIYTAFDIRKNSGAVSRFLIKLADRILGDVGAAAAAMLIQQPRPVSYQATDLCQRLGINAFELFRGLPYLRDLYMMGVLGPGRKINSDLDFGELGTLEFAHKLFHAIAERRGIGADLADGFYRAAAQWGRLDEDLAGGLLPYAYWGLPDHYDPRYQVEWGYGSVMGDRDINEHGLNMLFWMPTAANTLGGDPFMSAEEAVNAFSETMKPYDGDPLMLDYSEDNMYSPHIAKTVAWHRHYTRFWKQSVLFCDYLFPDIMNAASPTKRGLTGVAEPKFLSAVTGASLSFVDGIELGRKIFTLDNAVWTLQGRTRDLVRFAPYIYKQPLPISCLVPGRENGKWKFINPKGRSLDEDKFEQWKQSFYELEGWDPKTGWPRRKTLNDLGIDRVADELAAAGKLGGD
jgi:aldehyde:ferredoxin oxidoreductase